MMHRPTGATWLMWFLVFNQFEVGGYSGSYATWTDIIIFQLALNKDRDKIAG